MTRMACIKHTSGGGVVSAQAIVMVYAWLYVAMVISLSVLVYVRNWGGRENVMERISDVIWVVTTLLISAFGLVKLTSEDPHAIRNSLRGRRGLMNARQVYEYLEMPVLDYGVSWKDALKGMAAAWPGKMEWLSSEETCFCDGDRIGDIRLPGGLPVRTLPGYVGLPGVGGMINIVLGKYRKSEEKQGTGWLHVKEEVEKLEVDIAANVKRLGKVGNAMDTPGG